MAFNVPTSGQYITFPMDLTKAVEITWSDKYINYSAVYYVARCFWGYLKGDTVLPAKDAKVEPQTPRTGAAALNYVVGDVKVGEAGAEKKIDIRGSTDIFIASEYFDDRYKDGALARFHLQELCKPGCKWITLKLTSAFHYGQQGEFNSLRRFIVYHPINPPAIFQHRFSGLKAEAFFNRAEAIYKELPPHVTNDTGEIVSAITGLAGKLVEVLKSAIGHYLHQFSDDYDMKDARNRYLTYMGSRAARLKAAEDKMKELTLVLQRKKESDDPARLMPDLGDLNLAILEPAEAYLLSIQIVESNKAKQRNDASDLAQKKRWLAQIQTLSNVVIEGHTLPKFDGIAINDEWCNEVNRFLEKAENVAQFKEARVLIATIQEQQNRLIRKGPDESFRMGVALQAEVNNVSNVNDSRQELKNVADAGKLRRTASDDHLKLSAADNTKPNRVLQNAGLQKTDSKTIGRNNAVPTAKK